MIKLWLIRLISAQKTDRGSGVGKQGRHVGALLWKTLRLRACSLHILPPRRSLSNDWSITATICGDVMFLESEREGPVVSICLGLWNIPVLQHLHGCQTDDKTSSLPLQEKGAWSWCDVGSFRFLVSCLYLTLQRCLHLNDFQGDHNSTGNKQIQVNQQLKSGWPAWGGVF